MTENKCLRPLVQGDDCLSQCLKNKGSAVGWNGGAEEEHFRSQEQPV